MNKIPKEINILGCRYKIIIADKPCEVDVFKAIKKFETIAKASEDFMKVILENVTDCADRSAALRAVREARMWSNAAVSLDPQSALPIDHDRN